MSTARSSQRWELEEKLDLLIAVLKSHGRTTEWARVQLPVGRSQRACRHALLKMMKSEDEAAEPDDYKSGANKIKRANDVLKKKRKHTSENEDDDEDTLFAKNAKTEKCDKDNDAKKAKTEQCDEDNHAKLAKQKSYAEDEGKDNAAKDMEEGEYKLIEKVKVEA